MNLVKVEILEGEPLALEQPGHRVDRRHQQSLAAVDVIDGGRLRVHQVREDGELSRSCPLVAAEQDG